MQQRQGVPHRDDLAAAHARIAALERELAAARARPLAAAPRARPPGTAIPEGYDVVDRPDLLRIAWRVRDPPWPSAVGAFAGLCTMIVVAIVLDSDEVVALCAAAVVCGVVALWQLGDRVQLEVRDHRLLIARSAVSRTWPRTLARGEIDQLYCVVQHDETRHSYEIWCRLSGGGRLRLVRGVETAEAALFVESALERRLGIPDRPVDGELPRT